MHNNFPFLLLPLQPSVLSVGKQKSLFMKYSAAVERLFSAAEQIMFVSGVVKNFDQSVFCAME